MNKIKMIPWILIAMGVFGLLQAVFFRTSVGLWTRLLDADFVRDSCEKNKMVAAYVRFSKQSMQKTWMRLCCLFTSCLVVALGIAVLVLLEKIE